MNDNACVNYEDILENFFYGHKYMRTHFNNYTPKTAWSVDPFGHSLSMPILLQKMGFEGLVINRIHFRDKIRRKLSKNLDFLWTPTEKTKLLTHVLSNHYTPYSGFVFSPPYEPQSEDSILKSFAFSAFSPKFGR